MSTFRHKLNGVAVEEPLDWEGFDTTIERDFAKRTISIQFPSSAKFGGQGYDTIRGLFVAGFCDILTYSVEEKCGAEWWSVMKANIIVGDCVFNLGRCEVDASLVDDGIGARIENNRKLPIRFTSQRTKNADTMTAVSEIGIEIFDPTDPVGTYLAPDRRMIDWYDTITHAVSYITDLNVPVQSDWYTNLPDDERWAITIGVQIRTAGVGATDFYMEYSFDDLFIEMAKKFNLWLFIARAADGSPILRIEQEANTYSGTQVSSMPAQDDLIQEVETDLLFASVAVGSENELPNLDATWSLPFLVLIGQSVERFGFEGVCNTNTELDLVNKWNIGTNLIEAVIRGNTDHDDEIFLIQYDQSTGRAIKGNDFTGDPLVPPYQYNPLVLNFRVLSRYNMANNIAIDTGDPTNLDGSVQQVLTLPLPQGTFSTPAAATSVYFTPATSLNFSLVVSDPGGNFQLSPGRYTAPSQGFYSFVFNYTFIAYGFPVLPPITQAFIRFQRFDVANTLVDTEDINSHSPAINLGAFGGQMTQQAQATAGFVMNVGDYVTVRFGWRVTSQYTLNTSMTVVVVPGPQGGWTFAADGTPGGGAIVFNANLAKIIKHGWERHIPAQEWADLMADPRLSIGVSPGPTNIRTTWPLNVTRNMGTGDANLSTITDRSQPL